MQPKISVIVPVYKAEKYLHRCVGSLLAQTFADFEIILVDDGSPDNCGEICDEYAKKDNRFKVIHQKNGGVSLARQAGLDKATGDYIIHCDPDDWIEPEMLQEMLTKAQEENADMVICDHYRESNNEITYCSHKLQNPITAKEALRKMIDYKIGTALWDKLMRKEICKGITFSPIELAIGEDQLFCIKVVNNDIKITYLPKAYYHYRVNQQTSLTGKQSYRVDNIFLLINEISKIIDENEYDNLFVIKKLTLNMLFNYKQIELLKTTFPEIHNRVKSANYNLFSPLPYFLAMALKGHPYTAYYLYKLNINVINFIQRSRALIDIFRKIKRGKEF